MIWTVHIVQEYWTWLAKPCALSCQQGVKHRSQFLSNSHQCHFNDTPTCAAYLMLFKLSKLPQQNPQKQQKLLEKNNCRTLYWNYSLYRSSQIHLLVLQVYQLWHKFLEQLHARLPSGCGLEGAESFHGMGNFCLWYNCSNSNSIRSRINSTFQFFFFIMLHRIILMLIFYQHLIRLFVVLWKLIGMYIR